MGARSRSSLPRPASPFPSAAAISGGRAPVFSTAAATTKSAATVMGAGFENPANACSVEITPEISSTMSAPSTAIIGATQSLTSAATVISTMASVNQASTVTGPVREGERIHREGAKYAKKREKDALESQKSVKIKKTNNR